MSTVLFWFRNDLRLHDQPALRAALTSGATHLLPAVCLPAPDERTPWGFARVGSHRRAFTAAALRGLHQQTSALGNPLLICQTPPATAHRWRYADTEPALTQGSWWDAQMRLGLCGDWLHGGKVEGAWLSGRALAQQVLLPV